MAAEVIRSGQVATRVPELRRSLGLASVALFLVVACSNLQWVATAALAGPSSLTVWVLGGIVMFVPLAIVVVSLSACYPQEGGMYVWTKVALGPFAGFITAWTYWTCNLPYFAALLYFTAGNAVFVGGHAGKSLLGSPAYFIGFSIAGLALGTIVNVLGLGVGKWLNNVGAVSRWSATVLLIVLGGYAWAKFGSATPINATTIRPGLGLKDIIFWSVIAFAWTGPESIPLMGGEVKDPRRTIPLGLAIAAPVVAIIYIAGTAAVLAVLTPSAINSTSAVVDSIGTVAERVGWTALTPIAAILVTLSCLGSVGAWIGASARLPFVAGIDHYLPRAFGKIDPRWGAPTVAILAQSAVTVVFIVLGQTGTQVKEAYRTLVDATVIVTLIPFLFIFSSAIKIFRETQDALPRWIPGGRRTVMIAGFVGLLTTCGAIVLALFPADDAADKLGSVLRVLAITLLVVGTGVALYYRGARTHRAVER